MMKPAAWMISSVAMMISCSAFAGDPPSIGGQASITASIGNAGVINGGGGASGADITLKQSIASVLHGSISGGLTTNVTIGNAGVLNVGGGASGAKVDACQSIGTIGSDCAS